MFLVNFKTLNKIRLTASKLIVHLCLQLYLFFNLFIYRNTKEE